MPVFFLITKGTNVPFIPSDRISVRLFPSGITIKTSRRSWQLNAPAYRLNNRVRTRSTGWTGRHFYSETSLCVGIRMRGGCWLLSFWPPDSYSWAISLNCAKITFLTIREIWFEIRQLMDVLSEMRQLVLRETSLVELFGYRPSPQHIYLHFCFLGSSLSVDWLMHWHHQAGGRKQPPAFFMARRSV